MVTFWNGNHQLTNGMNQLATCIPGERRNAVGAETASLYCQTSHSTPAVRLTSEDRSSSPYPALRNDCRSAWTSGATWGGSTVRFVPGASITRLAIFIPHRA